MTGSGSEPGLALDLAIPEADALGHDWLGGLHILLGIARTHSRARRFLDAVGVSHPRLVQAAGELLGESAGGRAGSTPTSRTFNPAGARAIAWAERHATARGEKPGEDDLLAAVLWDRASFTTALFRRLGVSRAAVVEAFRREGGSAPNGDPPADRPHVDWGEKIELTTGELRIVLREIPKRVDIGTHRFAWNQDGRGQAFVVAERTIDLRGHVDAILAAAGGTTS